MNDPQWRGQLGQDAWIARLTRRAPGYFVEVGAGDGVRFSNTVALERDLGWDGICIEPGPDYAALVANRRCRTDDACVYDVPGAKVEFRVDRDDMLFNGIEADLNHHKRRAGVTVTVLTQTIGEVLSRHGAPSAIDFLSVDTEGSELRILSVFPFDRYRIGAIAVEHNWEEPKRTQIRRLLRTHGFVRVRKPQFDDWYLNLKEYGWLRVSVESIPMLLSDVAAVLRRNLLGRPKRFLKRYLE